MKFIAKEFIIACECGLLLDGQDEYGNPQYIATEDKFNKFREQYVNY